MTSMAWSIDPLRRNEIPRQSQSKQADEPRNHPPQRLGIAGGRDLALGVHRLHNRIQAPEEGKYGGYHGHDGRQLRSLPGRQQDYHE